MEWLIVIVAIAVLGAGAVVAGGAWGRMRREPDRDDYHPTLPPTRITGADLRKVRFQVQPRGYDMSSVDDLLDRLAREIDQREAELTELREMAGEASGSTRFAPEAQVDTE